MADVDPALGQEILDVAQRQRVLHVHHHDQTDDLRRAVEISERVAHSLMLPRREAQWVFRLTTPSRCRSLDLTCLAVGGKLTAASKRGRGSSPSLLSTLSVRFLWSYRSRQLVEAHHPTAAIPPSPRWRPRPSSDLSALVCRCRATARAHSPGSKSEAGDVATMGVFIYLPDVDAHHERARHARAEIIWPPHDESYGRTYGVRDLDGHPWFFTSPKKVTEGP